MADTPGEAPFLGPMPGGISPAQAWWLTSADGIRLRAAYWPAPDPIGHVLFFNGRTEFIEKVSLPAAELVARGLSVVSLDWRGQGLSDRLTNNRLKGHIDDFASFQNDVDALVADPLVTSLPGPRVLFAHSMGGIIGTQALLRPEIKAPIKAAVLSAPMFDIALSKPMRIAAGITMTIGMALNKAKAWPPFGDVKTPYALQDVAENVLTQDAAIWAWMGDVARQHPETSIATPTLGWFRAAMDEIQNIGRVMVPVCPMLCLVGGREMVVDPDAVADGAKRLGAELCEIDGGLHELLIEEPTIRAHAWTRIDRFLADQGILERPAA